MEDSSCLNQSRAKQSPMQSAYLHFNAILPLFIMILCLGYWGNIVLAVFLFQIICMVLLPLIYITTMMENGLKTYEVLIRHLLRNSSNQWPIAIAGFFICVIGGFIIFLGIQSFHIVHRKDVVNEAESDGLNGHQFPAIWMVVGVALEFTFVNSFLEEWFWRVFLYRELAGYNEEDYGNSSLLSSSSSSSSNKTYNSSGDVDEETGLRDDDDKITINLNTTSISMNQYYCGGISIFGLPYQETPKILMSCYYASYHVIILLCFVQYWIAIAGFFGLVLLGRIFVFCRENERFGIVTGFGLHAGLDGAFCVIMAQLYFRFV